MNNPPSPAKRQRAERVVRASACIKAMADNVIVLRRAIKRERCQPDHVLGNEIACLKAEPRPGAGEVWLAATKHDGVDVESILINETKVG